ncbi:MAG TPA: hypothetical protein VF527_05195 [Pyrinomonadaceae bacterium]|jgi:hypothetical protein
MSDYLWDKTGEPEEDVAQLENLLGALKYKQRPLEIPADAMPTVEAAATARPVNIFSRPRLALAASLLLTLLAGAWLITRQDEPQKNQLAEAGQGRASSGSGQTGAAVVPDAATVEKGAGGNVEQSKLPEDKVVVLKTSNAGLRRASRPPVAKRHKLLPRVEENMPAPREEVALGGAMRWQVEQPLTPQQREATEQLMLALRLASAKLNYAQREMQEIGRAGR